MQVKHYSIQGEDAYVDWVRRLISFHGRHHPAQMGAGWWARAEREANKSHNRPIE
jgi:hypothetical protein